METFFQTTFESIPGSKILGGLVALSFCLLWRVHKGNVGETERDCNRRGHSISGGGNFKPKNNIKSKDLRHCGVAEEFRNGPNKNNRPGEPLCWIKNPWGGGQGGQNVAPPIRSSTPSRGMFWHYRT